MKTTLMFQTAMIVHLIFVTVTSCTVHASLKVTPHDYTLMHYTVLIGEENFTPGRPLVIVLPQAEEGSTSKEMTYLIQELHISSRWPVLVFNVNNETNRNMYTEIHQHYSYIILIAGTCKDWEQYTFDFQKQLFALSQGTLKESRISECKIRYPVYGNLHAF